MVEQAPKQSDIHAATGQPSPAAYEAKEPAKSHLIQAPVKEEPGMRLMHAGFTKEEFITAFGREPVQDDLERVNCPKAGLVGHFFCGICPDHHRPRFECCVPNGAVMQEFKTYETTIDARQHGFAFQLIIREVPIILNFSSDATPSLEEYRRQFENMIHEVVSFVKERLHERGIAYWIAAPGETNRG